MTYIRSLAAFAAALILAIGSANAADVAAPRLPVKAAAVAGYGWDGFYLGATAGGALQNTVIDDKNCNLSCSSQNLDGSGFTAGVTAGWNFQFGHGVLGIEGDLDWGNFKATFNNPAWPSYHSAKWEGFGTLRGRAGVAFDRVLMYATGGLAFVKINDFAQATPDTCDNRGCFSVSGVQTGIAAGAGVEYALAGPWSVKGEYLYVALPSKSAHDLVSTAASDTYNVLSDAHILRLGLNYNFSGHPAGAYAWAPSTGSTAAGVGWTGFYAGVVGGYGLQNAVIDDKECNLSCSSWNMNGSGFTVGGTAGWNYQFGRGLVGVEADLNWADFKASYADPVWVGGIGSNHSEQWKWFSTLRGRAGMVAGRSLLYVTGGLALVDVDYNGQSGGGCGARGCFSITGVTPGLAAGFGTEYALAGNWSAKGEYLYVDLPSKRTQDRVLTAGFNLYNAKADAHIVRVGLNYHASPVGTADPAPAPRLPQWNGIYVGANGGGALQNTVFDDKSCFFSCSSQNLNGSGFTAGGTAGWNHQLGSAVFGLEGDFNWAGFRRSLVDPNWGSSGSIHSAEWKWFATARARGGVVVDRALIYATAGFAFVDVDESIQSGNGCDCFALSGVRTGIAAGVGAEYALAGPWSVKGEYLYVGLPTKHLTDNLAPGNTEFTANVKSEAHMLRAGINYHFN